MRIMPVLDEIASERVALADELTTLTEVQWATASLCGDWTIRQVAGHLLMPLMAPTRDFIWALIRAKGNFDRANDRQSRAFALRPTTELVSGLKARAGSRFHPPGFGHEAPMAELVLHGQDIRRPLGRTAVFSPLALQTTLELLTSPKATRAFSPRWLAVREGLRYEASDLPWSFGDGALITGPGASLAYALAGRTASLGELDGPGVAVLQARHRR